MFSTKKLAALERESERLVDELSRQTGIIRAAIELLSAFEPDATPGKTPTEERLRAALEDLRRLSRCCDDCDDVSGSAKPLVERIEAKLASNDRTAAEASHRYTQVERLAGALEAALNALPEDVVKGMVKSFPVYEHWVEAGGKAWVTTAFCQLGGCEYRGCAFDSYHEALVYAALREAMGERVETGGACPECYAEYMRDCA